MRRAVFTIALALSTWLVPAVCAQNGIELHGAPGSVTSPATDGRLRGIPASVTTGSLVAATARHHQRQPKRDVRPLYAEPYYGYYVPLEPYADSDQLQPAQQPQTEGVSQDDEQSAQSDDSSRYGEHYFDHREYRQAEELEPAAGPQSPAATKDDSPLTTLIYRDGHKSEVRNYAIVGSNLIDLTKSPVLKKIPLDSLDLGATRKENEDNGVDFHTP